MDPLHKHSCFIDNKILKGPEVPFPPGETNIGKTLLDSLRKNRDFIGHIDTRTGESLTFAKLLEDSCRCALWFRKNQIIPGDVIAIYSNNYLTSLAQFLAVWYVGAIVSPWHSNCSFAEMRYYLALVKPKMIFVDEGEVETVKDALDQENLDTRIIVSGNSSNFQSFNDIIKDELSEDIENFECSLVDPEDIAIFSLTSGSTGMPKFIKHTYEGQRYKNFSFMKQFYENKTNMVICVKSNLSVEYTVRFTNLCINTSSLVIAIPKMIPEEICKAVEKYKVQYIPLLATLMEKLVKSEEFAKYDLSSLQHVMVCGSKMKLNILENVNCRIPNCVILDLYGLNDVGGVTMTKYTSQKCNYFGLRYNVQVKFLDIDTGEMLGPNKPGEMYVKAPHMMKGYYQNPKATDEAIDSEGWFHTGDFAYYDNKGTVYFIDRLKAMIRYKNHLISPYEIQEVLSNHPEVIDVAVIGIPYEDDSECPTACVIKASDSKISAADLLEMSASLGENKSLRRVIFVEEIPYLSAQKINRLELIKIIKNHDLINNNKTY